MQDKVVVILSVYNKEKTEYFRQSVDSVLQQSYSLIELFIGVDGPVGEELKNAIASYEEDPRVRVFWFSENRGLAKVLNDLLNECFKEGVNYIARMDSDDIALPERLYLQMDYLKNNPNVDLVGGAINEIDENGNNLNHIVKYPITPEECFHFFSKRNPFAHPTVMFRRTFFEKTGCFYPTEYIRNEDTGLWLEGFKHGVKGANLSDVTLNFRVTNAMFTQRRNGSVFAKSQLQLRKKINKELGYGFMSYVYANAMYLLMISPSWLLRIAYKVLR